MHPFITDIVRFVTETLIPIRCAICRREYPEALCPACTATLAPAQLVCTLCGKPNLGGITHAACTTRSAPLQAFSAYDYRDPHTAQSIIAGKYNLVADVFRCYAPILGAACAARCIRFPNSAVCPVPLHPRRLAWRGFNQAELLAAGVAQALALPLEPFLIRTRYTRQQKDLRAAEREQNVQNCFAVNAERASSLGGLHVLLVDDVYTTGHTLHAAARVLRQAGAANISFVTLAKE